MPKRDRAAYMREWRAKRRSAAPKVDPHLQCDRLEAQLRAEIAALRGRLAERDQVVAGLEARVKELEVAGPPGDDGDLFAGL